MRLFTPQITWHGGLKGRNDPVLSLDFHPFCPVVATGGTDGEVRLWRLEEPGQDQPPQPVFLAGAEIHERGVNCVRFSPGGTFLASGSDDGSINLWHIKPQVLASLCKSSAELYDPAVCRAAWARVTDVKDLQRTILRGRGAEIYDISWSATGEHLAAACISQCVQVWRITRQAGNISGRVIAQLDKHNHFVQGVVWDPVGAFLASVSADRTLRIYNSRWRNVGGAAAQKAAGKGKAQPTHKRLKLTQTAVVKHRYFHAKAKNAAAAPPTAPGKESGDGGVPQAESKVTPKVPKTALFADETLPSFFRRVDWTPDGSALVVPAGVFRRTPDADAEFATHIIGRGRWHDNPVATLLARDRPSVAVRMCPKVFGFHSTPTAATSDVTMKAARQPSESGDPEAPDALATRENFLPAAPQGAWSDLRHRSVFAVLTTDGIFVYDTAHPNPIVVAQGLHYANLTDACWSSDGRLLLVSSRDGYVTMLRFDAGELGPDVPEDALPEHMRSGNTARADEAMQKSGLVHDGAPTSEQPSAAATAQGAVAPPSADASQASISATVSATEDASVQRETVDPATKKRRIAPTLVSVA